MSSEDAIAKAVEQIVDDKTHPLGTGDPRFTCIWEGTRAIYCGHYGFTDWEWQEVVRRCKTRGIGVC